MRALNDPVSVGNHVDPEILTLLKPTPTAEELNQYMIEMSERNNISLEEINVAGHKFTVDFNPIPEPSKKEDSFADLERQLKDKLNVTDPNLGPGGFNPNQGYNPNQGGMGFNPNQPSGMGYNPNQPSGNGFNPNQGGMGYN